MEPTFTDSNTHMLTLIQTNVPSNGGILNGKEGHGKLKKRVAESVRRYLAR